MRRLFLLLMRRLVFVLFFGGGDGGLFLALVRLRFWMRPAGVVAVATLDYLVDFFLRVLLGARETEFTFGCAESMLEEPLLLLAIHDFFRETNRFCLFLTISFCLRFPFGPVVHLTPRSVAHLVLLPSTTIGLAFFFLSSCLVYSRAVLFDRAFLWALRPPCTLRCTHRTAAARSTNHTAYICKARLFCMNALPASSFSHLWLPPYTREEDVESHLS